MQQSFYEQTFAQHSFHICARIIPCNFRFEKKFETLPYSINIRRIVAIGDRTFFIPFFSFLYSLRSKKKKKVCGESVGWKKISRPGSMTSAATIDLFRGRPLSQSSISSTNVFSLTFRAVSRY